MARIASWMIFVCICYFLVITFGVPHVIDAR